MTEHTECGATRRAPATTRRTPASRQRPASHRRPTYLAAALAFAALLALAACGGEGTDAASASSDAGSGPAAEAAGRSAPPAPPGCEELAGLPADSMETVGDDGLLILGRREGEGRAAVAGDTVVAHYVGCLTDGTKFDASYDRNRPITFPLGQGKVIAGWDQGIEGMKPDGVRVLRIPPELGYGARGTPQGPIPPDATLLFHVRLVDVMPGAGDGSG